MYLEKRDKKEIKDLKVLLVLKVKKEIQVLLESKVLKVL
jgi:hypothetical protein